MEWMALDGASGGTTGPWRMDDQESQTKFDHLVSVKSLYCNSHSLSQVPSVRNMAKLEELYLHSNKITMVRADDFAGATSLLMLKLDNNGIVSVAASKDVAATKRIKRQWAMFLIPPPHLPSLRPHGA